MNKPILNTHAKIFFDKHHGILNTSDLQTITKFIQELPCDLENPKSEALVPKIIFDGKHFKVTNENLPSFLRSYVFQDEYEANLAAGIWYQYSKKAKKNEHELSQIDYNLFTWIFKACIRLIGQKSK